MNLNNLQANREKILEIAAKHGAYNVRIFGSVARGEATEESDIDFLVDVGEHHSSWFPVGLKLDLEDFLQQNVDIATQNSLHRLIRERVLREAVLL